jgi:hypothetical protein
VIKGWDLGVAQMRKGEKSLLTCTAPYAYGDSGSPPKIPPGATLQFEVRFAVLPGDHLDTHTSPTRPCFLRFHHYHHHQVAHPLCAAPEELPCCEGMVLMCIQVQVRPRVFPTMLHAGGAAELEEPA